MPTGAISTEALNKEAKAIYHGGNDPRSECIILTELLCICRLDLSLKYVNSQCCLHFDKTPDDLKDKSFLLFVLEKDRYLFQQRLSELSLEVPILSYECKTINPGGKPVWYRWTTRAIFSKRRGLLEYQCLGEDITKDKQTEQALLEAKKRYQTVVEDQMELVCRYLPDCTLTFCNRAYCQYHGKKHHELLGTSFLPTIDADDKKRLFRFLKSANPDNPTQTRVQKITKSDGKILWVEWRRRALFDEKGALYEIQSVGRDITDLKTAEETLKENNIVLEKKNTALTEVLGQIEQQKQEIKNDVISNVHDLFIPLLEQRMSMGKKEDLQYFKLLKRSLEDLTSSFGRKITQKSLKLTPREIQLCNMIKRGLTSKEIASLLNISLNTVSRHRHSIRKKAEIIEKKENLYNYLQSL